MRTGSKQKQSLRRQPMSSRYEYIRAMQAKLDGWNFEIETLTARAGEVTTDIRNRNNEQIESLKSKLAVAWKKIELSGCVQRAD
jgi:hypothetical protein